MTPERFETVYLWVLFQLDILEKQGFVDGEPFQRITAAGREEMSKRAKTMMPPTEAEIAAAVSCARRVFVSSLALGSAIIVGAQEGGPDAE